jgi:hypothetical protein
VAVVLDVIVKDSFFDVIGYNFDFALSMRDMWQGR